MRLQLLQLLLLLLLCVCVVFCFLGVLFVCVCPQVASLLSFTARCCRWRGGVARSLHCFFFFFFNFNFKTAIVVLKKHGGVGFGPTPFNAVLMQYWLCRSVPPRAAGARRAETTRNNNNDHDHDKNKQPDACPFFIYLFLYFFSFFLLFFVSGFPAQSVSAPVARRH